VAPAWPGPSSSTWRTTASRRPGCRISKARRAASPKSSSCRGVGHGG
jgi:hypothetical protein